MVIVAKNPVHAVLFLILAFFNAAGLFVLLGAEFLAMILVIVYVGAVAVLFLFVVMMLDVDFAELRAGFIKNAPIGPAGRRHRAGRADRWCSAAAAFGAGVAEHGAAVADRRRRSIATREALGRMLYTKYVYFFQVAGLDPAGRHDRRHRADAAPQGRRQAPVDRWRRWRARRRPASRSSRCRRAAVCRWSPRQRGAKLMIGKRGQHDHRHSAIT